MKAEKSKNKKEQQFQKRTLLKSNSVRECRLCLEPGIERRCCGNYYCNVCYYKFATCQSCAAPVEMGDGPPTIQNATDWQRKWTFRVVVGVPASLLFTALCVLVYTFTLPETNFGLRCTSHLGAKYECVTYDSYIANDGSVAKYEDWVQCPVVDPNERRPIRCVCGDVCSVSSCAFKASGGVSGRDFKKTGFWATQMVLSESFEGTGSLSSTYWASLSAGTFSSVCGSQHLDKALRFFSGVAPRFLETAAWDVSYGGLWQFSLKYADGSAGCPTLQKTLVSFQYLLPGTSRWITIDTYPRAEFLGLFVRKSVTIPKAAWSSATRFRWTQDDFMASQETWMLDNIQLFQNFNPEWHSSQRWGKFQAKAKAELLTTECCYRCYTCKNTGNVTNAQCRTRPGLESYSRTDDFAIEHEYLVAVVGVIALFGFIFRSVKIVYRSIMSGSLFLCKPCVRLAVRNRIRREHNEKVRKKAHERSVQLAAEKAKAAEEEKRIAIAQAERTKHLKADATKKTVAISGHLLPEGAEKLNLMASPEHKSEDDLTTEPSESEHEPGGSGSGSGSDAGKGASGAAHGVVGDRSSVASGSQRGSVNTASDSQALIVRTPPGVVKGKDSSTHAMVRQAKADKKAAEELERRKMEKIAVQTALVDLDAEALKADEERQRYAVWNLGTYAAAEADRKADEERAARVKLELAGGQTAPSLYGTPVLPWNESVPDYTGENPPVDALYKKGPFALAVNFYKTVPERRRTADVMDEQLLQDLDALERQQTPSPKKRTKALTNASPQPKAAPPKPAAPLHEVSDEEYSEDSELSEVDTAEYVSESDIDDLEVDVNEVLRSGHHKDAPIDDTGGYLPQLFTSDERNRTDLYRPRRSIKWLVLYIALGMGLPGLLGIFLILQKGGELFSEPIVFRMAILDIPTKYLFLTACAVISDVYVIFRVALDVVGITPLTRPSFRIVWAAPSEDEDFVDFLKKSALVIDGGVIGKRIRVPLTHVRGSSFAKQYEPHGIAASFLFASLPWGVISLWLSFRYLSLAAAFFGIVRIVYGPWVLHKLFLVMYELTSTVYVRSVEQRDRFAASFCGFRARLVAFMMCATVGVAAFGAVAAFLTLIAIKYNKSTVALQGELPIMVPILFLLAIFVPYTMGWVLGCTHNLPVLPVLFLTNMDLGVKVNFLLKRKSEIAESYRLCAGDPSHVPGTGVFAPLIDGLANLLRFMPRNASHFILDPTPSQEAMCFVFGINNINDFKQSLTREFQLRRMEIGQKILRGMPVSDADMRAVGSHLTAPAPTTVIAKAPPPPRRRRRVRKPRGDDQDMVSVVVDTDTGSRGAQETRKSRGKKKRKSAAAPAPVAAPVLSDYEKRRQKSKGAGGRLPGPKLRKKYRPGRRRVGEAIPNSDEEETSQASDEGPIDITPRRLALTQASARSPAGKGPKPDLGSDSDDDAAAHFARLQSATVATPGPSIMSGVFGGSEDSVPRAAPSVVTSLRGPAALQGSFVEVDETVDNPTPSPRFLKSLKYSRSALSPSGSTPVSLPRARSPPPQALHHSQGRLDGTMVKGASEATKQSQRALLAAATPADIEAARRVHLQRTDARHNDSERRLRATAAGALSPAVLQSPSRVHPEDRDLLTPFKMVEAAKEGVPPMAWAGTPPPARANSRRNAI